MPNVIAPLAQKPITGGLFGGATEACDSRFCGAGGHLPVSGQWTLSSEIFSVGGGRFPRTVVGVTRGWIPGGGTPSAEEYLNDIRGEADLVFPSSALEEIELARSLV